MICLLYFFMIIGAILGVVKLMEITDNYAEQSVVNLREKQKDLPYDVKYSKGVLGRFNGYYLTKDNMIYRNHKPEPVISMGTFYGSELQARLALQKMIEKGKLKV